MKKILFALIPPFIILILLLLFSGDYLIFGGEGNFLTDFKLTRSLGSNTWVRSIMGIGFTSAAPNTHLLITDLFAFLQGLGLSFKTVNIISVLLVYSLPFLSMLWLLHRVMKVEFWAAYLIALFYVLNPLSTYHFHGLMFWNIAPLFVFPILFGCLYKHYFSPIRLFLSFGLLTALLSFSFSNIPYLGVFQILLFISVIIIPFMRNVRFKIKKAFKNLLILEASFILFNAWWLINLFRFVFQDVALYYPKEFAISWVTDYVTGNSGMIMKLFSLTTLISQADYNYFTQLYFTAPFTLILFIPFFLIIWNFLRNKETPLKKYNLTILFFILVILFLNKGANAPFGGMYVWMLENIPYFYIFKTPLEKFSPLLLFLIALALVAAFKGRDKKWTYGLLSVYVIACSIPYWTLNFIPDYPIETTDSGEVTKLVSKKYIYKENDFNAIQAINKNKLDYRYVSTPGSGIYQETIQSHDNKYYRGMNPFLHATNKPFITAYSGPTSDFFYSIFHNFSNHNLLEGALNIYGVKKIVLNQNILGSFGFIEPQSASQLFGIFSRHYDRQIFGSISIFNRKNYLPHFYTADTIIHSEKNQNQLSEIFGSNDYETRSAIYLKGQGTKEQNEQIENLNITSLPVIEYKKISPIKYRLILHGAQGQFPLIFSENFHPGWKLYLGHSQMNPVTSDQLAAYKILKTNEGDQATMEEVIDYLDQDWISTLGEGKEKIIEHQRLEGNKAITQFTEVHNIDFISKSFYDTLQNNNLPSGSRFETWFDSPLQLQSLKANGYANSWLMDIPSICAEKAACQLNPDGTYEVEIVVSFWPERLVYLGLTISVGVGILSGAGVIYIRRRKKLKSNTT